MPWKTKSKSLRLVARLAWLAPALLLVLTVYQIQAAYDLRATWIQGQPAMAEVTFYENVQRYDVTYGYVNLEVELPDGQMLTRKHLSLPTTLLPRIEGQEQLAVHVRPGADQEVVIDALMPAQWLATAGQAGMAFLGFLILSIGIFLWNRHLRRTGDPAERTVEEAEREEITSAR